MKKICVLKILFIFVFFLFSTTLAAQKTPTPKTPTPKTPTLKTPTNERLQLEKTELERPVTKGLNIEKKLSGRLPTGYRNVVTKKQRDDIYAIQKNYAELIELLKIRIVLLEQECDQQVDALLTSDQVQKIRQMNGILESEKYWQKKETSLKQQNKTKPTE
ncbi:MAG: hypothetical protein LBE12_18740 [Planctomycetaceae bacterium]|jgi:hypothetical protein|nr:hypothetical protein [Planctomycetaceae bacterium]